MKFTYIFIFFIFLSAAACETDTQQVAEKTKFLQGRWNLINAELNGQPSPALETIYYEFGENNFIKTNFNLSEQEETGTFTVKEDRLIQQTSQPIVFQIVNKTDSTLEMTTALRGSDFKLLLKKTY